MTLVRDRERSVFTLNVGIISIHQSDMVTIWVREHSFRSIGLFLSIRRSQPDVRNFPLINTRGYD